MTKPTQDKETLRKAVAVRFDFDGYGYQYMDAGSGSDWLTRKPDAEPLFSIDTIEAQATRIEALEAALLPFARLMGEGVNMNDPLSKWVTIAQIADAHDALESQP